MTTTCLIGALQHVGGLEEGEQEERRSGELAGTAPEETGPLPPRTLGSVLSLLPACDKGQVVEAKFALAATGWRLRRPPPQAWGRGRAGSQHSRGFFNLGCREAGQVSGLLGGVLLPGEWAWA